MIRELIAKNRRNFIFKALNNACHSYIKAFENGNYQSDSNGERRALRIMAQFELPVVFDVGANVGLWAKLIREYLPKSHVHCFEVIEPTFQELKKNTSGFEHITLNNLGLSNAEEELEFKYYPERNTLSSLYDFPHNRESQKILGKVIPGDEYCKRNNIENIDLLKIDTEGAEMLVLGGFKSMLENQKISVIQMEYGGVNILSKSLLRDYYNFFEDLGYSLGKIYPNYVDFSEYNFRKENFILSNFIAVRDNNTELRDALAG